MPWHTSSGPAHAPAVACIVLLRHTPIVAPSPEHCSYLLPACRQDLKNAVSPAECCEALGLPQMKGRKWHVQVRGVLPWHVRWSLAGCRVRLASHMCSLS